MHGLMIDNWTLQEVEDLLTNGLDSLMVGELVVDEDRTSHSFSPKHAALIQIDALLSLLGNIVFFDKLLVDARFTDTWQVDCGHLAPLEAIAAVQPTDFSSLSPSLGEVTESLLAELCVTPSLKLALDHIQTEWRKDKSEPDPHLSALVWGGAGQLARSHLASTLYSGHPSRQRLIRLTRMFSKTSAVSHLEAFLQTQRATMFRYRGEQLSGTRGHFSLPPIPVQVIEEADSIHDLIPIAVRLRDQNVELREWLAGFQRAIDRENESKQMTYERTLADIARGVASKYRDDKSGSMGVSINVGFLKFEVPRKLSDFVRGSVGVRATVSSLLLSPRGENALEKLLSMLGEGRSQLGRDVFEGCRQAYAVDSQS